jgi:hypothetical protein
MAETAAEGAGACGGIIRYFKEEFFFYPYFFLKPG